METAKTSEHEELVLRAARLIQTYADLDDRPLEMKLVAAGIRRLDAAKLVSFVPSAFAMVLGVALLGPTRIHCFCQHANRVLPHFP